AAVDLGGVRGELPAAELGEVVPGHVAVAGGAVGRLHDDDLAEAGEAVEHRLPAVQLVLAVEDGVLGGAVARDEGDLVGREGRVHRGGGAARVDGAAVGQDVSGAVRQHQSDHVARFEREGGEAGGGLQGGRSGLGPCQRLPLPVDAVGVGGQVAVPLRG